LEGEIKVIQAGFQRHPVSTMTPSSGLNTHTHTPTHTHTKPSILLTGC